MRKYIQMAFNATVRTKIDRRPTQRGASLLYTRPMASQMAPGVPWEDDAYYRRQQVHDVLRTSKLIAPATARRGIIGIGRHHPDDVWRATLLEEAHCSSKGAPCQT